MSGRIKKEMGKRSRERSSGERRKPEKKARLSEGPSLEVGVVMAGTEEAEEDSQRAVEVPCPLVVEIADSPEETPSAGPEAPSLEDEPTGGAAGVGASGSPPTNEEMSVTLAREQKGVGEVIEARDQPSIEGSPAGGLRGGDVGPAIVEARQEPIIGELLLGEAEGAGERIEAPVEPAGKEQVLVVEERDSDGEGGRDRDVAVEASPVQASGRLVPGLAELSEGPQIGILLKEAKGLKASQPEVAQIDPSGEGSQSGGSDPAIEAAFADLMRSVLYPGAGPLADRFVDLELVDAAFGRRDVVKDVHLLPEVDNPTLMGLVRSYISRSALVARALCWRLSLATGASIQARKVNAELRLRAEASDTFKRLMETNQENLARMKVAHQTALKDVSKLRLEVEELRGRLAGYDDACLELSQIKSKHAGEMETVKK